MEKCPSLTLLINKKINENLTFNRIDNISISLEGGYNCVYAQEDPSLRGNTTIFGTMTISNGTVTVENIIIQ